MKNLFLAALLFLSFCSFAQTIGRVKIEGNIKVPLDSDAEGITIFNKNSSKGTTSDRNGDFQIAVIEGDSLYFSALQFRDLLVVVDRRIFETGRLQVEITEGVNELPEVVVRPHNLSGNLEKDLETIVTVPIPTRDSSAFVINDFEYEFRPDSQTAVHNAAAGESGIQSMDMNILAVAGMLVDWILPKKTSRKEKVEPRTRVGIIQLERHLRTNFENDFFEEVLKIEAKDIPEFVIFCEDGVTEGLLKPAHRIDLIEYLVVQSENFRKSQDAALNDK